jgi:HD-like signal output (HDOD) protein
MNVQLVLSRLETIPPMPALAWQLLESCQKPDVDLSRMALLIESDPSVTTNLLRLCNSPLYGVSRQVTSVRQAASLLGWKQVVALAVTLIASRYLAAAQSGYNLAAGELWRNSVAAALTAELLAEGSGYPDPGTAYTAGLLQDLGKIVLAEFVHQAFREIWTLAEREGLGFEEAERRVVGISHAEAGGLLLGRWGFPPHLVESVKVHHHPASAEIDPPLARISHLADAVTMTLGLGVGADGLAYPLDREALASLGFSDERRLEELLDTVARRVAQADALFASGRAEAV